MRVGTIFALTIWAVMLSACERRNFDLCSAEAPYNTCEAGKYCYIAAGQTIGNCIANECTPGKNVCPSERPICNSEGRCTTCTSNSQCSAIDPTLPFCVSSRCVACSASTDCKDTTKPVCDTATNSCHACSLHSECDYKAGGVAGDGVCAKDDTLTGLAKPILRGSCVDSSRVLYADDANTLSSRLAMVSTEQPYVKIRRQSTNVRIDLPAFQPELHVIGPFADTAPPRWGSLPPIDLVNPAGDAIRVPPAGSVTLEGLLIRNSQTGLFCDSKGTNMVNVQTKVRLLRSLIGGSAVGIRSLPKCELSIEQSWIGKGPDALNTVAGNDQAMVLDSTKLDMVNTVVFHNYKLMPTKSAGILLNDSTGSKPPGRILSSTFAYIDNGNSNGVLAVDCGYPTADSLSIVNTLFLTRTIPMGNTYVDSKCRGTGFAYVGSNEMFLIGTNNVVDAPIDALINHDLGQLGYSPTAPTRLTRGGTNSFSDGQGSLPLPSVDIVGNPRDKDKPSIGAYEAAK